MLQMWAKHTQPGDGRREDTSQATDDPDGQWFIASCFMLSFCFMLSLCFMLSFFI